LVVVARRGLAGFVHDAVGEEVGRGVEHARDAGSPDGAAVGVVVHCGAAEEVDSLVVAPAVVVFGGAVVCVLSSY